MELKDDARVAKIVPMDVEVHPEWSPGQDLLRELHSLPVYLDLAGFASESMSRAPDGLRWPASWNEAFGMTATKSVAAFGTLFKAVVAVNGARRKFTPSRECSTTPFLSKLRVVNTYPYYRCPGGDGQVRVSPVDPGPEEREFHCEEGQGPHRVLLLSKESPRRHEDRPGDFRRREEARGLDQDRGELRRQEAGRGQDGPAGVEDVAWILRRISIEAK